MRVVAGSQPLLMMQGPSALEPREREALAEALRKGAPLGAVHEKFVGEARVQAGVFYTPQPAVRYLARAALSPILKKRPKPDWRTLRILDPACGAGAFLVEVLKILRRVFPEVSARALAETCLFGVDVDAGALEVARLALAAATGEGVAPEAHLVRGDALIRFDWSGDFAAPFDVVLGNPPYLRPHRISEPDKRYLSQHYVSFQKKSDLYVCFIERALERLKPGGHLGYLISRSFLTHDSFEAIRRHLLRELDCRQLLQCPDHLFPDASVRTAILVGARGPARAAKLQIGALDANGRAHFKKSKIDFRSFENGYKAVFDLSAADSRINALRTRLRACARPLGEAFDIHFGLKTGDDSKWIHETQLHPHDRPLLTGEDVQRFSLAAPRRFVCYAPEAMRAHRRTARPAGPARFEQPKLLFKDTTSQLAGAYDDKNNYAKDVLIIIPKPENEYSLLFALGVLNSRLMTFYFRATFDTVHVQKQELAALPVLVDGKSALRRRVAALAARGKTAASRLEAAVCALYDITPIERELIDEWFTDNTF